MTVATQRQGPHVERPNRSGLAEVIELILDKGLVIDVFVRVSLVGIELITVDARVVVASVDTYLRFAEATNRLDLYEKGGVGLPGLVEGITEAGARGKTSGVLDAAAEKVEQMFGTDSGRRPEPRQRPQRRERS
ncbi:MAG TPA: gas vesicle protein GvpJ [Pseudonocardiaceae bacterium]|nr:gas vesicle protein GvpJ [Pseudonocardiaceae bacterium]